MKKYEDKDSAPVLFYENVLEKKGMKKKGIKQGEDIRLHNWNILVGKLGCQVGTAIFHLEYFLFLLYQHSRPQVACLGLSICYIKSMVHTTPMH